MLVSSRKRREVALSMTLPALGAYLSTVFLDGLRDDG